MSAPKLQPCPGKCGAYVAVAGPHGLCVSCQIAADARSEPGGTFSGRDLVQSEQRAGAFRIRTRGFGIYIENTAGDHALTAFEVRRLAAVLLEVAINVESLKTPYVDGTPWP